MILKSVRGTGLAISLSVLAADSAVSAETIFFSKENAPVVRPRPTPVPTTTGVSTMAIGGMIDPGATMIVLGQGYNAVTGEILPEVCIEKARDDLSMGASALGGTINHERIGMILDMAEHQSASATDAGFSFTYKLISVGFGSGSSSSSYYNQIDQYARVYRRLATQGYARVGGKWSATAASARTKPRSRFVDVCGTHYIRAIYLGHLLDQTLRFTLNQSHYGSTDRSSFNFGVKNLIGFDYSNSTSAGTVNSLGQISIVDESRGLINVLPTPTNTPGGVQTLVRYAREDYPKAVQASRPDQAIVVGIEVVPYYQLYVPGSETMPKWPDEIMTRISDQGPLYAQLVSVISDLNFASNLPDPQLASAYEDARDQIATKLASANTLQADVRAAARTCYDLLAKDTDDETARRACEVALNSALTPQKVQAVRLRVKP